VTVPRSIVTTLFEGSTPSCESAHADAVWQYHPDLAVLGGVMTRAEANIEAAVLAEVVGFPSPFILRPSPFRLPVPSSSSYRDKLPPMSRAITRGIRVEVEAFYLPERSEPGERYFFFAYRVRIANEGVETARLVSREWVITDGDGNEETVRGDGVVGEQPVLRPGEAFEYTSFCPLPTEVGAMQGSYFMKTDTGDLFRAEIAPFTLAVPGVLN
jgi:ApaG protein